MKKTQRFQKILIHSFKRNVKLTYKCFFQIKIFLLEFTFSKVYPFQTKHILIKSTFKITFYNHTILLESTFNAMFGGQLLTNHIQTLSYHNSLLAVFSNQLYLFDLNQTQVLKKIQLSENLIKAWTFVENSFKIIALDDNGSLIEVSFQKSKKNTEVWYQNFKTSSSKKIGKSSVSDARIVVKSQSESSVCIYFVEENNLYEYQNGAKNVISKQCSSILHSSQNYVISTDSIKPNTIKIIKLTGTKSNEQLIFEHSTPITACTLYEENLIIGDQKGKIFQIRNYFQTQKVSHQVTTKYEWHVHKINGLFLDQEYLYSCGEEGTVVMWHLRQNKKDFLPRIGTEIDNVFIFEGIVYSLLKDNTIAAVDLGNDKLMRYYKTVVNPFGFVTKGIKQNSFKGKNFTLTSSESNNRNLLAASGLSGSLQIINLNDGSNHEVTVLPRNMISRIDDHYPEPHDICDVNFNKDWTLMCCSTNGINHNCLHFYKNEGYNLEYSLISRVQNPHEGLIKVLSYNNIFITYAENQKTIRFWSRVRRAKKSIIEKEEEYFVCSGEITYRQKSIKNCHVLSDEHLLLVNFEDEIILIDLKKRSIQMAFCGKNIIEHASLVRKSKNLSLILACQNKISAYDLNRSTKKLTNARTVYVFEHKSERKTHLNVSSAGNLAFLVNYASHQVVFQFDVNKNSTSNSFTNENSSEVSILSLCYQNGKLLAFGSDSTLTNLTNSEEIIKFSGKHQGISIHAMETESDSGSHFEHESFETLHKNYVERQNVRNKGEINQCLEKIELQMYPSLGFSFSALCQKMFI